MVDKIYEIKNELVKQVEKDISDRGVERIDGDVIDMIKDLAEAEKNCMKARYYKAVTEAMTQGGQSGYGSGMGYQRQGQQNMSGYGSMTGSSGYGSMGHGEIIDKLAEEYRKMNPDERMRMKNEVLTTLGAM